MGVCCIVQTAGTKGRGRKNLHKDITMQNGKYPPLYADRRPRNRQALIGHEASTMRHPP